MRLTPLLVSVAMLTACSTRAVKLATESSDQKLRERPQGAPQTSPHQPPILVIALDGVSRDLLYDMLRPGELPHLAELLGGDGLRHAYLDTTFLSTMPSTTMDAWVAAMTGKPPAETGVTGNEYFIREKRQLGRVADVLREKGRLEREWVIVTADHGHSQVLHDPQHALGAAGLEAGAPTLLRQAGFRIRPLKQNVDDKDPFSAVLAYGGATAYVYLADRSTCPGPRDVCRWDQMPRYDEDVLPAAEAFYRANKAGTGYPGMKDTLDLILVRKPRPVAEIDRPFEVYIGGSKTMPLDDYLRAHPHPTYIDMVERMHDLAVGTHGERAGDIMLLAHFGDVDQPAQRYYFAHLYRSWHGSPSRADSEIPLIVANRHHDAAEIGPWVRHQLGPRPFLQHLTDVILGLRAGELGE
jgi:hypothetical protein